MQLRALWIALVAAALATAADVHATPYYAARAARTCDNCHLTPNTWVDPPLSQRKCNLACQGCHVDPAGGGMRTVSGRFYQQATLPAIAASPRPTADWDRNLPFIGRRDLATTYTHVLPLGPNDYEESLAYADSVQDPWAWWRALGKPSRYGPWEGRYGKLRADPALRVASDIRIATLLSGSTLAFPMQFDVAVAAHPIQHATLFVNTGVRGRKSGYADTFDDSHSPYFREAFLLLHEAPYQVYAKGGRFVPAFGLRLDDHTASIRREFELDGSLPESRVTGIEVGAAPNYPVLNLSWFRMASRARSPDPWNIFDVDQGKGAAVNLGYRSLGWSLGGSGLWRWRPLDQGGDTRTYGVWGSLSPWFYARKIPLTYLFEVDHGTFQRASGRSSSKTVLYQELDWLAYNGVTFVLAHDWADPDREIVDDEFHRLQVGMRLVFLPGIALDWRIRSLMPAAGGSGSDLFLQLHVYN
jgi:hypothetical protein